METFENGLAIYYGFDDSSQTFFKKAWDLLNAFKFCKEDQKSILISKSKSLHPESDPKVGCKNMLGKTATSLVILEMATGNPLRALLRI